MKNEEQTIKISKETYKEIIRIKKNTKIPIKYLVAMGIRELLKKGL